MAPIGPSPDVPFTLAMVRHSSAAMTVAADANTAGPADLIAACIASWRSSRVVQLLAVASDDQQGVVGARAEHEHRHDRARLAVDGHAELGDPVAHRASSISAKITASKRDEEEDRRAVDHDQQEDHQRDRRQQQRAVDALEDLDGVGRVAGAAGDLDLEAAAGVRHRVAPELDRVEDAVGLAVALQVGGDDRRLAVRRADRPDEGRVVARLARQRRGRPARTPRAARPPVRRPPPRLALGRRPPGRPTPRWRRRPQRAGKRSSVSRWASSAIFCEVRRRQAGRAPVDDDRGRQLAALQLLGRREHLGRLGVAGQERGRLVLLGVGELAGQVGRRRR